MRGSSAGAVLNATAPAVYIYFRICNVSVARVCVIWRASAQKWRWPCSVLPEAIGRPRDARPRRQRTFSLSLLWRGRLSLLSIACPRVNAGRVDQSAFAKRAAGLRRRFTLGSRDRGRFVRDLGVAHFRAQASNFARPEAFAIYSQRHWLLPYYLRAGAPKRHAPT